MPGLPWVDPEKDMKAAGRAIRDGLSTRSIDCAAQGYEHIQRQVARAVDDASVRAILLDIDSLPASMSPVQ